MLSIGERQLSPLAAEAEPKRALSLLSSESDSCETRMLRARERRTTLRNESFPLGRASERSSSRTFPNPICRTFLIQKPRTNINTYFSSDTFSILLFFNACDQDIVFQNLPKSDTSNFFDPKARSKHYSSNTFLILYEKS